ncbi:HAMP domain-containing sensor histidine kinase, partial [Leptolyngbya sp. FACHB-711]
LINDRDYSYRSYEIRLVQQVANQCAIGLRQSRLYQAVQQQVEELTRLNLLKDDFLSTVSHELRSPITNAKMAAQMLEIVLQKANMLNPELPRPLDRYLQILKDECQREISLINNLLDLTRLNDESEPLRLTAVDLSLLIPQITQGFLERIQNQNQELIYKLPPDLPLVQTEVTALERVLIELVNNACKYTPPQEKIIIRVQVAPQTLQISICNTGIEIPEAERSRIFDRFYRIPNNDPWKHGGTGLGLALVRKLTERLKGTICLQVGSNQTTFVIELPRAIEE